MVIKNISRQELILAIIIISIIGITFIGNGEKINAQPGPAIINLNTSTSTPGAIYKIVDGITVCYLKVGTGIYCI